MSNWVKRLCYRSSGRIRSVVYEDVEGVGEIVI